MTARLGHRGRMLLRALQALSAVALVAYAAQAAFAVCGAGATAFFEHYVYTALIAAAGSMCLWRAVAVRAERPAWLCLGGALLAWAGGEVVYSAAYDTLAGPPVPSFADALWLAFYPAAYAALLLLLRTRVHHLHASVWLDGLIGALAAAAVGAALVFDTVSQGSGAAVAVDLSYLMGDLLLLAMVAGVFALTGWRPGRAWGLLGAGLAASAVVDGAFLYQAASGNYVEGTLLASLWPLSALMLGFAAWQPAPRASELRFDGGRMLVMPIAFALVALTLLLYHATAPVNALALGLAVATLAVVLGRLALALSENVRLLAMSREEALTDQLTGLGNRRKLLLDLDDTIVHARPNHPRALLLLDLDGFKLYNDRYGHPAGDALLARLGQRLGSALEPFGEAYRLGGDEFCAIVTGGDEEAQAISGAASAALAENGKGFEITSSCGVVMIPRETDDAHEALKLADQRVYAQKGRRQRFSVGRQTGDALLQALEERDPDLREHLGDVAELALAVGQRMGLSQDELDDLICAAELHDVGKVGVPNEILHKPGPLDDDEWAVMYEHTLAGDRILSAAPALAGVAKIVRSSHERYDGLGYPDRLSGAKIPLGARIVAVCDAYDAMTTDRPYRRAMSKLDALEELRRCAGYQFDPDVVEAFCNALESPVWTSDAPPAWRALRDTSRALA